MIVTLSGGIILLENPLRGKLYTGTEIQTLKTKLIQGEKCLENISNDTFCFFKDNKSLQTLWLLGDSHASSLVLAGEQVSNSLGMNMKSYGVGATPFPPINRYRKQHKQIDLLRFDDQRLVEQELYRQIKVGDVILISMRIPYFFGGTYFQYLPSDFVFIKKDGSFGSQENSFDDWISSVINLANMAQKQGAKVIIQTPTPEWEKEYNTNEFCAISKVQWFNQMQKRNCQIESKFFIDGKTGLYKHLLEKLNQLSNSHENIYLFDTYKIVCPESKCSFTRKGVDIYSDEDHISKEWARDALFPEIYKFISGLQTMDK